MAIKKIKKQFSDLQTSWMWSFESSVNARRSCLRIPSSIRKRRAPSLMVSVRSSFLWTRQSLEPCLFKEGLCKQRFLKTPKRNKRQRKQVAKKRYRHFLYLQCRVAAHLGDIFLSKNNKVFEPFPLENTIFK